MRISPPSAAALLDLFVNVVLSDQEYRRRLERHYRMFKNVVNDPAHPAHRLLRHSEATPESPGSKSIPPPPPRSGQRKRWR